MDTQPRKLRVQPKKSTFHCICRLCKHEWTGLYVVDDRAACPKCHCRAIVRRAGTAFN